MLEGDVPARPEGELTSKNTPHETESREAGLSHLLQEQVIGKLRVAQPGEDSAARPLPLMDELEHDLQMRPSWERQDRARAEQLTAWKQSVKKVSMAFEILAYPHLEDPRLRGSVRKRMLDARAYPDINTHDHPHRAPIELNDEEVRALSMLTQVVELPFDPKKRVYQYSDLAAEPAEARGSVQSDTAFAQLIQEEVFDKLSSTPPEEDRSFWPIRLMNQLQRELGAKAFREQGDKVLAEQLTAWKKSLQRVQMAYEVHAFPSIYSQQISSPTAQRWDLIHEVQETITDAYEHPDIDTEAHPHRGAIMLTDKEMRTLSKLTQAMELPFDPNKRLYRYSDLAVHRLITPTREMLEEQARMREDLKRAFRESAEESRGKPSDEPPEPPKTQT
jgi:hypothetical protein